jgi:Coenzyme PQQ synthesis protein D (PqqD)
MAVGSGPLRRSVATLWREGSFGVVVLAPGAAEPFTLTGAGRDVWASLAEPATFDDVVAALAATYSCDVASIRSDVEPVVEGLLGAGALEPVA